MIYPCPSGIVVMPIDSLVNLKISGQRVVLVLIPPVLHLGRDISKGEDFAMGVGMFVRFFRDPFLARFPFNRAIVAKPIADEAEKATHPIPPCQARRGPCRERAIESPLLQELCQGNTLKIDAKMVADAARSGDKVANEILDAAIDNLCLGIRNIVNLLDPEMILIGGGVSLNGEIFFKKLALLMEGKLMPTKSNINIASVTFGENSTIMGALTLVLHKVLNFELIN